MTERVSIVIANLNQAALTLNCIDSVAKHTKEFSYEAIVVDNGSVESEVDIFARASHEFKFVRLDQNMFFGEASNIGAEQAAGDFVVFLNNDIMVTPRWLESLISAFKTERYAGAVGAKILHPNNDLLEAGGVVRPDGWSIQLGKSGMKLPPGFVDATRITDYCSAACLLMRTKTFLDLGGFDPLFDPAYFEDVDLAIRLRSVGLLTYYCGASCVYHEESVTSNRIWSTEDRQKHIAANHRRLMGRWGRYLERRIEEDLEPEPLPSINWKPESVSGKPAYDVVLYSSEPLKVTRSSQVLLQAAAALQHCANVVIATHESYSRCRIYSLCRQFGIALESFGVRRICEIDQRSCRLIVTFGEPRQQLSAPQLAFERHGIELVPLIDRLFGGD